VDEQSTTLSDDEILSIGEEAPDPITSDADGDDTDTTDGDTSDSDASDADADDSDSNDV
jgi:hypothetical protein